MTTATRKTHADKATIKNRNLETRRVQAGSLVPHPDNCNQHSTRQASALRDLLEEVGFVGTLIGRDTPDGLQLIDGHLRADEMYPLNRWQVQMPLFSPRF